MIGERRLAGVGGVAFAVSLAVGFTLFGPKGGSYSAAEIDSFVAQTSGSVIISIALFVISVTGLVVLIAYLSGASSDTGRGGQVSWATSLLAAAAFLIGWGIYLAPSGSIGSGGPTIDPGISYLFTSAGMVILFGVGGVALGVTLFTLAMAGPVTPAWVRAISGLAGISALLTWPFLVALQWSPNQWLPGPFYLVILWGLVIGIWLLITPDRAP